MPSRNPYEPPRILSSQNSGLKTRSRWSTLAALSVLALPLAVRCYCYFAQGDSHELISRFYVPAIIVLLLRAGGWRLVTAFAVTFVASTVDIVIWAVERVFHSPTVYYLYDGLDPPLGLIDSPAKNVGFVLESMFVVFAVTLLASIALFFISYLYRADAFDA